MTAYVDQVFAALEPLRQDGWPLYWQEDLQVDRSAVAAYPPGRPFGLTLRETGTTLYIEHADCCPRSRQPFTVGWLWGVLRAYAGKPLQHLWWNGDRWQRVDAAELERRLRREHERAHAPAVDEWGATAEDRRMLARHGMCWGD